MDGLVLVKKGSSGAVTERMGETGWRLGIPAGESRVYRWAQVDDYGDRPRRGFLWRPPLSLELRARVSAADLPGTWGFGFWNNPFTAELGIGGVSARLPALPNAAWFFHASPPNHLAFREGHPAQGFLAATFSSPNLSPALLALGVPALPLLALPFTARWVRRILAKFINEDSTLLHLDVTTWHDYRLDWQEKSCRFEVDGRMVFETPVSPRGKLGLVIWIDNQYAAFPPDGRLRTGALPNPPAWLEVELR